MEEISAIDKSFPVYTTNLYSYTF